MGTLCRIVAQEAGIPGQQLVAVASEVLREHVITGLCPTEEGHLPAQLAWLDPTITQPLEEARARIRIPASGALPNVPPDRLYDDRVDRLRKLAKASMGAARRSIERDIEAILRTAVAREWRCLVEAHSAFRALRLPAIGLDALVERSRTRVAHALANGFFPARGPDRLGIQLDEMEAGHALAEHAAMENDAWIRARARRSGDVAFGTVILVDQPRRNFRPCSIEIEAAQPIVRHRRDDRVQIAGTKVKGVVRNIESTSTGTARLRIEITNGVRSSADFALGTTIELMPQAHAYVRHRIYGAVRDRAPWPFYASEPPVLTVGTPPADSVLDIARSLRRR